MNKHKLLLAGMMSLSLLAGGLPGLAQAQDTSTTSQTGQYLSDAALTTKVKTALLAEKGLKSTDIGVETQNGTVQLSGFVMSSAQMDQAVDVTRHVKGVKDVKNDMRLKTAAQ